MKDFFNTSIIESSEFLRKSAKTFVENLGKIIALITLFVTALVLFTDVGFGDMRGEEFSSTLLIMLLASYLVYFSMYETGEDAGEKSEEYKESCEKYKTIAASIDGRHISQLRDFCERYSEKDAEYRRSCLLLQAGYERSEYEAYKNGESVDKKALRVFRKADRIKLYALTPTDLLSFDGSGKRSELRSPESAKLLRLLLKLIPTTVCSVLTVSIMLSAKENLTSADVIDGIFKISSLLVIGFRAYACGYNYKRLRMPVWIDTKTRLIDAFLKSEEQN